MALLVIVLAPEEIGALTLAEWDSLAARERVSFEHFPHPLAERLRARGVTVDVLGEEGLSADDSGRAVVVDPGSRLPVALARAGAEIRVGAIAAPDDLSAAHAAAIARRASGSLGAVATIMARLRSEDGCPWDREQSHESLRVHLVEEAYEVLDAIDRGSLSQDLEDELGDLLLQVVFHAQLAQDDGRFEIASVADHLVEKLVRRHPHVFGDTVAEGATDVVRNWEAIKAAEKKPSGAFDDIPPGLPALLYASKVQKRAVAKGFSPDEQEAATRARETVARAAQNPDGEHLGEALFWLTALARARGLDPEGALRVAAGRFRDALD